jgi:hypothetical protein
MKRVEILLDDQTEATLSSLANLHDGDKGAAVREALRADSMMEAFLDEIEEQQSASAAQQLERSRKDFREGKFKSWPEVKRKAGL